MMVGNENFLDTNIVVEFLRGNPTAINYLKENKNFVIPVVVLGELYFGVENAKQFEKHKKQLNDFIIGIKTVNIDTETAKYFAKIKNTFKKTG